MREGLPPRLRYKKPTGKREHPFTALEGRVPTKECIVHPGADVRRCHWCYQQECVRCRDLNCRSCGHRWRK